jgi:signal peptidase II
MKHKNYFLLVILLITIDQASKFLIAKQLDLGELVVVTSLLNLTHVHNYGAAFSFFSGLTGWQSYLLPSISIIASIAIFIWMFRVGPEKKLKITSLAFMLSGAIGNMIDRVAFRYVEDFLSFHSQGFYFPVFNVADTLLFIGVILLIISDTQLNKKDS